MRTKRYVDGLNNSQKIRVICDGIGFVTTVAGVCDMPFTHQRIAVSMALSSLGCSVAVAQARHSKEVPTGFATRQRVYGPEGKQVEIDVQVDLL